MCVRERVAKNLLKQATGTEKKIFILSPPPHLLRHPLFLSFSLRAQEYRLGPWDKEGEEERKEGGEAVSWWGRGESKGWGEEGAGDSFWSLPLNKSVRARQKESTGERERERERWIRPQRSSPGGLKCRSMSPPLHPPPWCSTLWILPAFIYLLFWTSCVWMWGWRRVFWCVLPSGPTSTFFGVFTRL